MGRRKGSLRHRLRRWLVCSSKNASPNRFLHEKDSLACSPSFEEHFRRGSSTRAVAASRTTIMEPSPPSAATATATASASANTVRPISRELPGATPQMNSTQPKSGTKKSTSPARSVHSAVTEIWSNSAARWTRAASFSQLGHSSTMHSVGENSSSGEPWPAAITESTTHLQTRSSGNSARQHNRAANYHHQARRPSATEALLSDDDWNINATSSYVQFGRSSWANTNDTIDHHTVDQHSASAPSSSDKKGKLNPPTIFSGTTRRSDSRKRSTSKLQQQPNSGEVKFSTYNMSSPDSVMASNDDGWGSFPSSERMMMFDDNPFFSFDNDFQAQQRNTTLAKNLFPTNFNNDITAIESTPDPDFFFLDEEDESHFSEKSSSQQNPSTHPTNTSTLPAGSATTSDNLVKATSSIPTHQDLARSQRIGITPYSPRWAADTNSSYATKLSSITPAGLLVINHEQKPADGDISSIGLQSFRAAKDEGSAKAIEKVDSARKNTTKSDKTVHFAKSNRISNKSFLSASSSSSDDEALDDNSSTVSAKDGNAFLFDTVENILGPRTMSADMESLGGYSNLSGNSKKSGRRYSSRTGGASSVNLPEHTVALKRSGSFHSIKSAPNIQRSAEHVHSRSDNMSVSSRRSVASKNSFREGQDVTATLLQLEGKLLTSPMQGGEYTLTRTTSANSVSQKKARKIVVLAPPGRLGIILANRTNSLATIVSEVRETSPLAGKIGVGDKIIAVDDENVSGKTVAEITKLMAKKVDAHRTLTFLTVREAE